jgi:hypothetical protein
MWEEITLVLALMCFVVALSQIGKKRLVVRGGRTRVQRYSWFGWRDM